MKKFKANWIAVFFILLVIVAGCERDKQEVSLSQEEFRGQLDQLIPDWMDRYEVPGLTIAVIKNGEIDWTGAYGIADLENQTRMKPKTICRVESISKSVTVRELYSPVSDVAYIYSLVADHYGLGHFIETLPNGQKAVFGGGQGNGWMTHSGNR